MNANRARTERGHAPPALAAPAGGAGTVLLAIGAANDTGALTVAGGVVLAVGLILTTLLNHATIEWGIMGRLDRLEGRGGEPPSQGP
ncbi:MAG TPA: hypothetical protein VNM43_07910 [Dehalococcoidia bacterium]|nr:hypothetical protein [Dehalococcoidia bacterium]